MKLSEIIDHFGKQSPSLFAIHKKHNINIDVLKNELKKGELEELEHTNDKLVANEIARDHLWENPFYYSKH